jgi:hypothetical protein
MPLRVDADVNALPLAKEECRQEALRCGCARNRVPGYSLGQLEVLSYDRRVEITATVTFDPELSGAARAAAEHQGKSFDAWLAETVEARLLAEKNDEAAHERRRAGLGKFLDEWEAEHGAFTDEELADAAREMGLTWPPEARDSVVIGC